MTHIVHVSAPPANVGDAAIRASMRQHMDRMAGERIRWTWLDIQRTTFPAEVVDRVNAEADLVIVGAGGLLMDRETNGPSGWQWDITRRQLDRLDVPLVLYGLGWNEFPYGADRLRAPDHLRRMFTHLGAAMERADLVGARNEHTAAKMLLNPWTPARRVDVVPDPAFFIEPAWARVGFLREGSVKVALCWAGDRPERRWRRGAAEALTFGNRVMDGLVELSKRVVLDVVIVPHVAPADAWPWAEMLDSQLCPRDGCVWRLPAYTPHWYSQSGAFAARFADLYRRMDVVLGMRKHSVILPLGQGTPVIGLGDQAEVRWTLEECGTPDRLVTSEDALAERVHGLIAEALEAGRVAPPNREAFDAFNRRVLALAGVEMEAEVAT